MSDQYRGSREERKTIAMEAWYVAKTKARDMLSSPGMEALLEKVKQICDVVIVDSAPVLRCAGTRILAKEVDEVPLVLQPDAPKVGLMKDSRQTLEAVGARVVGLALNKVGLEECECLPHHVERNHRYKVGRVSVSDVILQRECSK